MYPGGTVDAGTYPGGTDDVGTYADMYLSGIFDIPGI